MGAAIARAVRVARAGARWYRNGVRAGVTGTTPRGRAVSAASWVGFLVFPFLLLVAVGFAAAGWYWLSALGVVLAGLSLVPAVALSWRRRARRLARLSLQRGPRVGPRGASPEGKVASAVGASWASVRPTARPASAAPRVTVVIACFNDAHLLGAALHSVARQTMPDLQCVVVDDCSTDESMDVAMLYADVDRRFQVVRHSSNRGLSAARNTGLALAAGEYVTFLDSDDFLFHEALEQRVAAVAPDPLCVGSFCDWRAVPENTGYRPTAGGHEAPPRGNVHIFNAGFAVQWIASAPIIRTDVMRATGGFDETLATAEDADMWARLLRGGVWLSYAEYVGVAYRQREGSMVRRSPLHHLDVVSEVVLRLDEPWDDPWQGAPSPVREPLSTALRRMSMLPRQLNFLALHLALYGPDGIEERHLPHDELRTLPEYPTRVFEQSRLALKRLNRLTQESLDELVAAVLEVAPPHPGAGAPHTPPATTLEPSRARLLRSPVEVLDAAELQGGEPVFLLAPQSRYHVAEVGPLLESLRSRGVATEVYLPPEAPATVARELSAYVGKVYAGEPAGLMGAPLTGAFMLNDWGAHMQEILAAVKAAGGVSFAKVEGVQDFEDVDTGRVRSPYRRADIVLGQGQNDVLALPGADVRVVGSTRLERIWTAPPVAAEASSVLINFNFTYGVLTDKQDEWIWAAVNGARALGLDYEISLHPAQKNVPKHPHVQEHICKDPFSHALRRSGVLISRFSTVIYEAMALGVPAVYLNSHGEKVPTFQDPQGAFVKVTGTDLQPGLTEALSWRGSYRERAETCFRNQVDVDPATPSEDRTAAVIAEAIARR